MCCDANEECIPGSIDYPYFKSDKAWCSTDNKDRNAPEVFEWVVCPNELNCEGGGNKFIVPPLDGEIITQSINKWDIEKLFVLNDVCTWIILNPAGMGFRDWMWLDVSKIETSRVFVTRSENYVYSREASEVTGGKKRYGMLKGKQYYVTGIATS